MISADNDLNKLNLCDVFTALCQTLGTAGLILDSLPNPWPLTPDPSITLLYIPFCKTLTWKAWKVIFNFSCLVNIVELKNKVAQHGTHQTDT